MQRDFVTLGHIVLNTTFQDFIETLQTGNSYRTDANATAQHMVRARLQQRQPITTSSLQFVDIVCLFLAPPSGGTQKRLQPCRRKCVKRVRQKVVGDWRVPEEEEEEPAAPANMWGRCEDVECDMRRFEERWGDSGRRWGTLLCGDEGQVRRAAVQLLEASLFHHKQCDVSMTMYAVFTAPPGRGKLCAQKVQTVPNRLLYLYSWATRGPVEDEECGGKSRQHSVKPWK